MWVKQTLATQQNGPHSPVLRVNRKNDEGVNMPTFDYSFTVNAPLEAVSAFHHDTSVLKILTPPPIFVQLHNFEALGEDSKAEFTLWFGPLPIKWQVVHSEVTENGFTDKQVVGPLKKWKHRHQFLAISSNVTEVREHIEYEYRDGFQGLINRIMYSKASLYLLFTARKIITRKNVTSNLSN